MEGKSDYVTRSNAFASYDWTNQPTIYSALLLHSWPRGLPSLSQPPPGRGALQSILRTKNPCGYSSPPSGDLCLFLTSKMTKWEGIESDVVTVAPLKCGTTVS